MSCRDTTRLFPLARLIHRVIRGFRPRGISSDDLAATDALIGPRSRHLSPFRESLGAVIRRPDLVPLSVCRLQFDDIGVPTEFVETRVGQGSKAVSVISSRA